jgi:hypothetical protein
MSSAFHLSFQAPPVPQQTDAEIEAAFDAEVAAFEANPQTIPDREDHSGPAPLRMSKGAKAVAAADGITDDAIRAAIAEPDEVEPDPAGDGRMRLRRGSLRIVVARDGAVLSVRGGKNRRR